jgi:tetratricopeptide (TPR) repeat protein
MQTTANLWDVLCRDLEDRRSDSSRDQHRAAAEQFREAALQVFRPESPRLSDALEISGDVCQASGFFDDAIRDFEDSLKHNLRNNNVIAAARVSAKMALLLDHMEKSTRAKECYLRALELFSASHDLGQHFMLLSNLGALEKRTGHRNEAIRRYAEAVELSMKLYGEVHPQVALACSNLGVAYMEAHDWIHAENEYMRALGIHEKLYGAMSPDVAQGLANLAVLYHSSGNVPKAEAFYQAALKTYAAFLSPDDPVVLEVQKNHKSLQNSQK